jgi:N-methylhydantoinase A
MRIGIDIGGTFTDFVVVEPSSPALVTFKVLSTPHNPAEAVLAGLARLGADLEQVEIIHGSTVATNALLERKGARTALVATLGFSDLIEIGRQNRPQLYDWSAHRPPALVPPELRFEAAERVGADGSVLISLSDTEIERLAHVLAAARPAAVAICLLFSFLHPEHERRLAERLRQLGLFVSASCDILPEYREYERMSTTTINAYVSPILDRYLVDLEARLPTRRPLRIMQSNGGSLAIAEARANGVRCILSGPAGGVIGAGYVAQAALGADALRVLTFDMGGTSTDVALYDGQPQVTTEAAIGGLPIRIPVMDIHTIGAGGGSIAFVDAGGALRVGPQSAGADPGPACYGRYDPAQFPQRLLATVTDANLVLGRLLPEHFLGGQMPLHPARARQAIAALAHPLGMSVEQAALGIVAVANAHMARALRVISVERGRDPRGFTLLSFGGAGGLHAAALARELGMTRLLVPPLASTLSALGMLVANAIKDYTQTVMLTAPAGADAGQVAALNARLAELFAPLQRKALADMAHEGFEPHALALERALDMRYAGQSYELPTPYQASAPGNPLADFAAIHSKTYGYDAPGTPVEIVNLRLRATALIPPATLPVAPDGGPDPAPALLGQERVVVRSLPPNNLPEWQAIPVYAAERLQAGNRLAGPALVVRADTTIFLGPGDQADVDRFQNLVVRVAGEGV